ncbi:MAG: hypothetical protein IH984_08930 [Planctomycetes bacterium]|nr:hypothetical protein [Planctomycetota bacterium]
MRKPNTDESNVQMSDVLCDFCHRQWTEEIAMLEGHQGSCICGRCLTLAYTDIILNEIDAAPQQFACPMCLETSDDRASLDRADEPAWQSPLYEEAVICKRCIDLAATALNKDKDNNWKKPGERDES